MTQILERDVILCSSGRAFTTDPAILSLRTIPLHQRENIKSGNSQFARKAELSKHRTNYKVRKTENIVFSCSKIDTALVHKLSISHDVHRVQVQI